MTGDQFLDTLRTAIAPRTITNMTGKTDKIVIKLSDGKQLDVRRQEVREAADQDELDAYVAGLVA